MCTQVQLRQIVLCTRSGPPLRGCLETSSQAVQGCPLTKARRPQRRRPRRCPQRRPSSELGPELLEGLRGGAGRPGVSLEDQFHLDLGAQDGIRLDRLDEIVDTIHLVGVSQSLGEPPKAPDHAGHEVLALHAETLPVVDHGQRVQQVSDNDLPGGERRASLDDVLHNVRSVHVARIYPRELQPQRHRNGQLVERTRLSTEGHQLQRLRGLAVGQADDVLCRRHRLHVPHILELLRAGVLGPGDPLLQRLVARGQREVVVRPIHRTLLKRGLSS
mmetsp:Transcript_170164/g.545700  ORF Transcript_170164/g.545700 Transcript_170164/m.545700 type:complete len:274 (-) Transcript_170164:420-1241(-)